MQDATRFAGGSRTPASKGAEWIHQWLAQGDRPSGLDKGTAPGAGIPAYVNHGRWVVGCPDCNNAQLACRTDKRFLCNECGNVAVSGLWRPVIWPTDAAAIETELEKRKLPNQNWAPTQSLKDLKAETIVHKEF